MNVPLRRYLQLTFMLSAMLQSPESLVYDFDV